MPPVGLMLPFRCPVGMVELVHISSFSATGPTGLESIPMPSVELLLSFSGSGGILESVPVFAFSAKGAWRLELATLPEVEALSPIEGSSSILELVHRFSFSVMGSWGLQSVFMPSDGLVLLFSGSGGMMGELCTYRHCPVRVPSSPESISMPEVGLLSPFNTVAPLTSVLRMANQRFPVLEVR